MHISYVCAVLQINDRAARWTVYTPPAGVHSDRLWPEDVGLSIVSVPESKVVSAIEEKKIKEGQAAGREHTFGFNVAANRPENATSRGCVGRIAEEGAGGRDGISAAVDNIVAIVKVSVSSLWPWLRSRLWIRSANKTCAQDSQKFREQNTRRY